MKLLSAYSFATGSLTEQVKRCLIPPRRGGKIERSEIGWGSCGPAQLENPHPSARSQVYAGCVNLPVFGHLPFGEGLQLAYDWYHGNTAPGTVPVLIEPQMRMPIAPGSISTRPALARENAAGCR